MSRLESATLDDIYSYILQNGLLLAGEKKTKTKQNKQTSKQTNKQKQKQTNKQKT